MLCNYLPPESYRYGKDAESYFTDSSILISDLSDCDLIVAGGDLNARTKCDLDYIPEVDNFSLARTNPDTDKKPTWKSLPPVLKKQSFTYSERPYHPRAQ